MSEDYDYIQASIRTQEESENLFKTQDPFGKDWTILKDYVGIDQNFKRRTSRTVSKATYAYNAVEPSTQYLSSANAVPAGEGAESKQINPGTVYRNGYGLFDVITPPYNMYELASYYDTSFANGKSWRRRPGSSNGL